jgi:DNA segregation ATPase FtsK/SpoIIIE, S-DNA-T family
MLNPTPIDRPPRIQPELPLDEVEIPKPPEPQAESRSRLIQIGLPLVTIVGYVLVSSLGGTGRNIGMLIPMALSVVASTAFSIYTYRKEKLQSAAATQAYMDRLVDLTRDMEQAHDQQRRFYTYNYPEPQSNLRIVQQSKALAAQPDTPHPHAESRLWERRTSDDDFGMIRLGIGTRPSSVVYTLTDAENFEDHLVRAAMKLAADSRVVDQVPVTLSLRRRPEPPTDEEEEQEQKKEEDRPLSPATHALAIAGESAAVYTFVRAVLAQMVIFHAPGDLRLYVLASSKAEWAWTRKLPHSQEGEHGSCLLFVDPGAPDQVDRDDDEGDEFDRYLEGLRRVLVQRKIRLQEKDSAEDQGDPTLPFCLVIVDLLGASAGALARLHDIESEAAVAILLAEGATLGATLVFLVPERVKAPSGCQSIIEVELTTPTTNTKRAADAQLHFRYAETGLNSFRYLGVADVISEPTQMEQLAADLSQLTVRQGPGANVPSAVSYMSLAGYESLDDLRDDAWKRWAAAADAKHANWLRVPLGVMAGNKRRTLVFSAKRDGVHGMVAGSTGSGKSELLISLIAGMAVNYAPSTLNFVLVDYKGGGAFKEFEDLPHCVDIITNLAADGVTRMFTAIQAEMRRRQALNTATGTKNIVDYHQKGLHLSHAPYPFLFIIIDEFAEMIADRAEYKAQLESITRVGRAQGVSLILAAQRPSGVTDQMRSNIKFRICLRVETPPESREMLRRVDAAFLPTGMPGRGYLQVGNDEVELIQIAYTGEPYVDPNRAPLAPVIWLDRNPSYDPSQDVAPPELYKVIITTLDELARKQNLPTQRAPWPNVLPIQLALSDPLISNTPTLRTITSERYLSAAAIQQITLGQPREATLTLNPALSHWLDGSCGWVEVDSADAATRKAFWSDYALRPVVGLLDNPYEACHLPLTIDLPRGHTTIYGASGWGKSTFLRTLAVSLAASHSPNYLHLYLLDLGGRGFGVLRKLPHVGAVITPDEEAYEERVTQLIRELDDMITARKTLLSSAGNADIYSYNQQHPENPQPAIVVLLDNFSEFVATFGGQSEETDSVLQRFIGLLRQAKLYGVHVVVSAGQPADIPSAVASLFTERLTLRLADSSEYRTIVGGAVEEIGPTPGRGYARVSGQPLALQVAIPINLHRAGSGDQANENRELELLAEHMQSYIASSGRTYRKPLRVDGLPREMLLKHLIAREQGLSLDPSFLPRLTENTRRRWEASRSADKADWLTTVIGVISGNRPRTMKLEAKADGVHGLIAGGTGSGKSELLMTLIVSMALRYAPDILNFVLVDYKGGGAFKPFERLPHVVDIVTNLNRSAVKRVFTAIRAEMERRQALNTATGTKDIIDYRKKGLHLSHAPYPHLFIIIDEYAEMIGDNPEFAEELDSITRLGRAQGVNLLLASQRPTGISDQMRANIKLRICLRVEQLDTSREMLRRPDAAFLPNGMPGRGYLQVGNDAIELIQVAYTGEKFADAPLTADGETQTFYSVVVQMANDLLGATSRPTAPWPAALPSALSFDQLLSEDRVDPASLPLLTLGVPPSPLHLSIHMRNWFAGHGGWPGVDWSETALRGIAGLADNPYAARQLPLIVDLSRGHAALFGASGWGKTTFLRALALGLAATHSPAELHLHVLDLGGRNLEALSYLPHLGTLISPDASGYEERLQQLWRELNELIDARKHLFSSSGAATAQEYNHSGPAELLPAQVVLIDNLAELIETFGAATAQKQDGADNPLEAFIDLARQGRAYGVHFVITAGRPAQISSKLYNLFTERFTLRLADSGDYSTVVGSGVNEVEEINGRGYARIGRQPLAFQIAVVPGAINDQGRVSGEARHIQALGTQMQAFIDATGLRYPAPICIDALPSTVSYRELLARSFAVSPASDGFVDALRGAMQQQWAHTRAAAHADWLAVPLGTGSGNRDRTLQLEAKRDGVHALIAGGTGSGKSELLMTLIVGLATCYSPEILNFVLVDYKGGGAFKPFEQLPHVVDIVTNLNKAAVHRMFTAIDAEMRRRQRMNAQTGTKDIVEYRKKGLHLSGEPYPHLFVIIDEYAEMINDNPDYRSQLESITRVGRAQGVNLVLASQRPTGVSDQMRANIKLRICLRVEQLDTSREMLRRPDAAFLPNGMPGRGYLQVGNENLELIQVAYTGEPQPGALFATGGGSPVSDETPRLYDAIVSLASELNAGRLVPRPWPGFLPDTLSLETPLSDGKSSATFMLEPALADWQAGRTAQLWSGLAWRSDDGAAQARPRAMCPAIGLVDVPDEAQQIPLTVDLSRNHLAVFGDAGSGKSTLLRSLLVSLAATHSPDELHAYVLDLGGRAFRSLEQLPHMGALIYADEARFEERLQRLLDTLSRIVDTRQRVLSDGGVSSIYEYNAQHPAEALPAILVLIDNFAELQEGYEALIENTLIPLVRRSLSAGICFVVSANIPPNLTNRLYNLFSERLTFRQTNVERYLDIVGRGAVEIDDQPGRGYLRAGQRPLLFHSAMAAGVATAGQRPLRPEHAELADLIAAMHGLIAARGPSRTQPEPINVLPDLLPLADLIASALPPQPRTLEVLVGLNAQLKPAALDLQQIAPHMAILGPPLSGRTTALHTWIVALTARYAPAQAQLVLVDMQRKLFDYGGKHTLSDLPHVVATISDSEQLPDLVKNLDREAKRLASAEVGHQIFVLVDNFDEFNDDLGSQNQQRLATLARRYGRDGLHFIIATTPDTSNVSDLRRRIMAANLGIGLRTAQAVDALKVLRTPAGLKDRELSPGRGYLVRSGVPLLLQVASPYALPEVDQLVGADGDHATRVAAALDRWVEQSLKRYPQRAEPWGGAAPAAARPTPAASDPKALRRRELLQIGAQRELEALRAGKLKGFETRPLLVEQLLQLNGQDDPERMLDLLYELMLREKEAIGIERSLASLLISPSDEPNILHELDTMLKESRP